MPDLCKAAPDDQARVAEALVQVDVARRALTSAICLLGLSEGKTGVQIALGKADELHSALLCARVGIHANDRPMRGTGGTQP